ncbi:MAG: DUF1232 domain-containing protein [Ignavibacteriaceae bacterium]|nr:DUF1232 domain-containing protein [Ignavibacteriaceae bacterium]NUM70702.1 DUF1232 domain-containing protein [Ignavibacteriaceae bacterium]
MDKESRGFELDDEFYEWHDLSEFKDEKLPVYSKNEYEEKKKFVEANFWEKLEIISGKLAFIRDAIALFRYMKDGQVSWQKKALVAAGLVYLIAPFDTIPDLIPFAGYLDDLGVITALVKFLGTELAEYYE